MLIFYFAYKANEIFNPYIKTFFQQLFYPYCLKNNEMILICDFKHLAKKQK